MIPGPGTMDHLDQLARAHHRGDHEPPHCRYITKRECSGSIWQAEYRDGVILFLCTHHVEKNRQRLHAPALHPWTPSERWAECPSCPSHPVYLQGPAQGRIS